MHAAGLTKPVIRSYFEPLLAKQLLLQIINHLPHLRIYLHSVCDQPAGVEDGAMIAPAEGLSDGIQRTIGQLSREEHRDLAWEGNILRPAFAGHISETDVKVLRHLLLNRF